jgi:hypothetical protein
MQPPYFTGNRIGKRYWARRWQTVPTARAYEVRVSRGPNSGQPPTFLLIPQDRPYRIDGGHNPREQMERPLSRTSTQAAAPFQMESRVDESPLFFP